MHNQRPQQLHRWLCKRQGVSLDDLEDISLVPLSVQEFLHQPRLPYPCVRNGCPIMWISGVHSTIIITPLVPPCAR